MCVYGGGGANFFILTLALFIDETSDSHASGYVHFSLFFIKGQRFEFMYQIHVMVHLNDLCLNFTYNTRET